jgi:hypothetical protein
MFPVRPRDVPCTNVEVDALEVLAAVLGRTFPEVWTTAGPRRDVDEILHPGFTHNGVASTGPPLDGHVLADRPTGARGHLGFVVARLPTTRLIVSVGGDRTGASEVLPA